MRILPLGRTGRKSADSIRGLNMSEYGATLSDEEIAEIERVVDYIFETIGGEENE